MRKKIVSAFVILCSGAFLAGGCTSKEAVKSDEALAPSTVVQLKQTSAVKTESMKPAETVKQPSMAPQAIQPATGAVTMDASQLQNALEKIYFNFDSSELSDQARASLAKNADMMRKNSAVNVRIEGNCDERGSSEYNLALGERRARAAEKYMTTMGVSEKRLSIISYGKEKPADPGHNETAWARNRRDEFVISSK